MSELTHIETDDESNYSVTLGINSDSEVRSYEMRSYLQNKDGGENRSNSFFVHFSTLVIAQIWDMPDVTSDDNNIFSFIRQEAGPYYISTFTDYDMTGLTSTVNVFFTDFDDSIFETESDVT